MVYTTIHDIEPSMIRAQVSKQALFLSLKEKKQAQRDNTLSFNHTWTNNMCTHKAPAADRIPKQWQSAEIPQKV